ncbi:family 1 encapsulin nanocompartment shell protein [Variovorax sp. J22P271]|uniref:encapsulin n=1 Tax=Variovorax davisae TaxID=3053515 RepID=UPI002575EB37|nr:family 1 encapsulin nanocompartment shell protein [Variovorax sp. J22P271]MDM0034032.1 family 1 encapsulin nanocompartment shell protein [Variovorax sp. J22P271]
MADNNQQVPWTDEQWARVRKVIQEEAARARVAAGFLPLVGPLPGNTDYVTADTISYGEAGAAKLQIEDKTTVQLPTLQVRVFLRGAQMADPDMDSALQLFRRAANILARLEDTIVFGGLAGAGKLPPKASPVAQVLGGQETDGLLQARPPTEAYLVGPKTEENRLVTAVSACIGELEGDGHFGPFAVAFGHDFFTEVQTPDPGSLVLPQDRIIPFLGGGPLVRTSTLPPETGVVVALGAEPVELVVATDVSLNFLQVTDEPQFVFRVYEKILLRIKEAKAVKVIRVKGSKDFGPGKVGETGAGSGT